MPRAAVLGVCAAGALLQITEGIADKSKEVNVRRTLVAIVVAFAGWNVAADANQQGSDRVRAFEVASVKRTFLPEMIQRPDFRRSPGRMTATSTTLRLLTRYAYDILIDAHLSGGPAWTDTARFNVEATAPGATNEDLRLMTQQLLKDRFGLVITSQSRTLPIYRLIRARADGKLGKALTTSTCSDSPDRPARCANVGAGPNQMYGWGLPMAVFAKSLTQLAAYTEVDRIVIDETGLSGAYDFEFRFAATRDHPGLRVVSDPSLTAFTTALQEQLGLKLQPASGPVSVWTIESARMPEPD